MSLSTTTKAYNLQYCRHLKLQVKSSATSEQVRGILLGHLGKTQELAYLGDDPTAINRESEGPASSARDRNHERNPAAAIHTIRHSEDRRYHPSPRVPTDASIASTQPQTTHADSSRVVEHAGPNLHPRKASHTSSDTSHHPRPTSSARLEPSQPALSAALDHNGAG
jgi:hypothetical protein